MAIEQKDFKTAEQLDGMNSKALMKFYTRLFDQPAPTGERDELIQAILQQQSAELSGSNVQSALDEMDARIPAAGVDDADQRAIDEGFTDLGNLPKDADDGFSEVVSFGDLGIPDEDAPKPKGKKVKVPAGGKYANMSDDEVIAEYTRLAGTDEAVATTSRVDMIAFIKKMSKTPKAPKAPKGLRAELAGLDEVALSMRLQEIYDAAGAGAEVSPTATRDELVAEILSLSKKGPRAPRASRRYNQEKLAEMFALRSQGKSYAEIGKALECSGMFVRNIIVGNLYTDLTKDLIANFVPYVAPVAVEEAPVA